MMKEFFCNASMALSSLCLLMFSTTACKKGFKLNAASGGHNRILAYEPLYMPDSNLVVLNNNSNIGYDDAGNVTRFSGEGYFRLHSQLHSPFVMNFQGFKLECDSSAEFNLNAFDLENIPLVGHPGSATHNSIRITLMKGSATVTYEHQPWKVNEGNSLVIGPYGAFRASYVESVNDSTWFTGHYFYRAVELEELAVIAKRLYNVNLEIADGFEGETLHDFSIDPKAPFAAFKLTLLRLPAIVLSQKSSTYYRLYPNNHTPIYN